MQFAVVELVQICIIRTIPPWLVVVPVGDVISIGDSLVSLVGASLVS